MINTPSLARQRDPQAEMLSVVMFVFMFVLAFLSGLQAVHGVTWGASVDFHRDASFVRAIVEGHYGEDPTYLGGALWYTPFVGVLEATCVWLSGHPVDQVIVQMGAYTNLLVPITFFIMVWYFFGPVRAVVCTALFLFFNMGDEPGWAVPTYSPRLIPVSFCQWFLYIEVVLIDRAFRSTKLLPSFIAGAGAGLSFLAHAAPALIPMLTIFLFTLGEMINAVRKREGFAWPRLRASIAAGIAFILVSLPFTWIIVGEYGMKVVNRSYFLYNYYALTLREGNVLLHHNISLFNAIALVGFWLLFRKKIADTTGHFRMARRILLMWFALSVLLMVYSYVVAVLDTQYGIELPGILPPFHFLFYAKAAWTVFAGLAAYQGLAWLAQRMSAPSTNHLELRRVLIVFAIVAVAITLHYPSYASRRDVFWVRTRNLAFMERTRNGEACVRINELLPWDAVILCDMDLATWPLLPSARKVVATTPTMGNPYQDQKNRNHDRWVLLDAMRTPATGTEALLDQYHTTHLLVRPGDLLGMPEAARWFPKEVYRDHEFVLLARK